MSLQKPSFSSQIPELLLSDANERDKYILNSLSIITQNNSWLVDETIKQSVKLEELDKKVSEVDEKLKFTNGKIANSMLQIKALEDKNTGDKETDDEVKKIVGAKLFIGRYLLNKYALIGFIALSVGLFRIIDDEGSRQLLLKVLGLG